jgi:hypothetical protein
MLFPMEGEILRALPLGGRLQEAGGILEKPRRLKAKAREEQAFSKLSTLRW